MAVFATNGAKLFIGGVLSSKSGDFVKADFDDQNWIQIGEVEALGSVGDSANEVTFESVNDSRTRRLKGTRNAGTMEIVCGIDYADEGQIALLAAEKTIHDYAFKLELNDAPQGGTPSERYFIAKVGSAVEALDTANSVMKLNTTLWVNSNVAKVNAAG